MADLSVADVLERAADLIEPEGAWTQGAGARDVNGNDVYDYPFGDRLQAVCFCASEAIWRITHKNFAVDPAHQFLVEMVGHVPHWNDASERTQPEVVAKLREAAALARGETPHA